MRILMFGMSSYPGGIENYIVNYFCNQQFSSENKIDFVIYENDIAYKEKILECGYGIKYVPHLKKNPIAYRKVVKKLLKKDYDCVYINMLSAANKLPVVLAQKSGIEKIILHAHSNSTVQGVVRHILHYMNKNYCDRIATKRLTCSHDAASWIFNFDNKNNKIVTVPNAIDVSKYKFSENFRNEIRKKYRIGDNEFVLGSVGRLGPEKNNGFMIDILKCLLDKDISAKLLLVGDGTQKEFLIKKAKKMDIYDSVIFAGTIINPYKYYSAFDAFLFPSQFEGFGIAALEAQSSGLRCYCSDTLSSELNISKTLQYLDLKEGSECWSETIISDYKQGKLDPEILNSSVAKSDYNIQRQIERIKKILYE